MCFDTVHLLVRVLADFDDNGRGFQRLPEGGGVDWHQDLCERIRGVHEAEPHHQQHQDL